MVSTTNGSAANASRYKCQPESDCPNPGTAIDDAHEVAPEAVGAVVDDAVAAPEAVGVTGAGAGPEAVAEGRGRVAVTRRSAGRVGTGAVIGLGRRVGAVGISGRIRVEAEASLGARVGAGVEVGAMGGAGAGQGARG